MIGSYPYDTKMPSKVPNVSTDKGYMAATTEYNTDATKRVDHSADSGFEGGNVGGNSARIGMLEEAVTREVLHMGKHPKDKSRQNTERCASKICSL